MSELVEWLTKVLDEEESGWRSQAWQDKEGMSKPLFHFGQPLTDLLLADIAAKRRIVERYRDAMANASKRDELDHSAKLTLALLLWPVWDIATAYADREGYDESWRP